MRKAISEIILVLLAVSTLALAFNIRQAGCLELPEIEWSRVWGGPSYDFPYSMIKTFDGGYAIFGVFANVSFDWWLIKTDSFGNVQWNKTYGGAGDDLGYSIVETEDGGYMLAGSIDTFEPQWHDAWLVKVDSSGNMQWNKTYGGFGSDHAHSLVKTSDGKYVMGCWTSSFGADYEYWLVKVDSSGNMQWNKTYGIADKTAYLEYVIETSDGGYAIFGDIQYWDGVNILEDLWLVKTDSSGNHQWNKTYGGSNNEWAHSVMEMSDSGYMLAGSTESFGAGDDDCWLVKVDSSGNMEWNKTYGGISADDPGSMIKTSDGGYAIAGATYSFGEGAGDAWLVKFDSSWNVLWNKTYGGALEDYAASIVETDHDEYVFAGMTESFGAGSWDWWLVKVAPPRHPPPHHPVGGFWTPVDKFSLVAPYMGIASTILIAIAATAICVKRVKHRKEKQ